MVLHLMVLLGGLILVCLGLWGSFRLRPPYDSCAAWCTPLGLIAVMVGIVLVIIPDFFT